MNRTKPKQIFISSCFEVTNLFFSLKTVNSPTNPSSPRFADPNRSTTHLSRVNTTNSLFLTNITHPIFLCGSAVPFPDFIQCRTAGQRIALNSANAYNYPKMCVEPEFRRHMNLYRFKKKRARIPFAQYRSKPIRHTATYEVLFPRRSQKIYLDYRHYGIRYCAALCGMTKRPLHSQEEIAIWKLR